MDKNAREKTCRKKRAKWLFLTEFKKKKLGIF